MKTTNKSKRVKPIHKATVLKQVRDTGTWTGYIAASNVNSGNINSNWNLGIEIIIIDGKKHGLQNNAPYVVHSYDEGVSLLSDVLNDFMYYNCDSELGKRVRFWKEV